MNSYPLLDKLETNKNLTDDELTLLIEDNAPELAAELALRARAAREKIYGKKVYIRGLIEFTNYCRNNCYYCGIRRDNGKA